MVSTTIRGIWGVLLVVLALAAQAQERNLVVAEQRVALVIGNAAYKVGRLRNPVNDARAMTQALKKAGFDVDHRENLTHRQMFEATRDFGEKLKPGAVALFYYAGHGLQVRDRNYLIPVEADLRTEDEAPYTSIDASYALDVMNRARTRVNIVILDACRNNPFAKSFRSASRGLAQMEAPSGTLIAYATAPGKVASDGAGEHGLYTQHVLQHLSTPGLPVEILFKRVRESVERETESQQVPWESSSLKGDFSFVASAAPVQGPVSASPAPAPDSAFELAFWDSIKASSQVADYQAYLAQYPNGRFALLAKARISILSPAAKPAPPPPAKVAAIAPTPSVAVSGRFPAAGEKWVYQYSDLWKAGVKGRLIAEVVDAKEGEVTENLSIDFDGRAGQRQTVWPAKAELRAWDAGPLGVRELSPYALALELVKPGQRPDVDAGGLDESSTKPWAIDVKVSEEDVAVPAGRFRATKVVITGRRDVSPGAPGSFEMSVWYAPETKRYVKLVYTSYLALRGLGNSTDAWHRYVHELVSAPR